MTTEETSQAILEFVRKMIHPSVELDTQLVAEGLLDSFDAIEVIDFIEEKFGLRIDPADIKQDDIASIRAMAAFVERARTKLAAGNAVDG